MYEAKTKATAADVDAFLAAVEPAQRQADARAVCAMMQRLSGQPPVMWGPSIVGFGSYDYRYASGHSGTAPRTGFSPRKAALTLYVMGGLSSQPKVAERLGKVKTGKGCLYINRLADVDLAALEELISGSLRYMDRTYPATA
jgi:hypothetical protein